MRVLWIGHFVPYPPRGGAPQRSFHLLKEAAKHAEVHFAGLSLLGHQPHPDDVVVATRALEEICRSVTVLPTRLRSSTLGKAWAASRALVTVRSYNEVWLDFRKSRAMVRAAIERIKPDLVHVDSVMIANLLPVDYRGPAVLNHHNVESHMMERRGVGKNVIVGTYMGHEARLLRKLERRWAGRFGRHIVVSDLDGLRLSEIANEAHCETVPNGVDVEYFRPQAVDEQVGTLVFCGRMNWYPNDEAMCRFIRELWPEIRRKRADVQLVVVGMNPTARLLAIARGDDRIRVLGFVEDVRPPVASAALYVCPILDGGGTRLKLLDAMALGKAIVATPLAIEGLEVVDGRDVVVREFGLPFVDAVVELLADRNRRATLAVEARRTAIKRYSWPDLGAKLVSVYRSALEEAPRRAQEVRSA